MKKTKYGMYAFFLCVQVIVCIGITGCNKTGIQKNEAAGIGKPIKIGNAIWDLDTEIGTEGMLIDYISESMMVFRGLNGLFVYDIMDGCMIVTLDLKMINCEKIQGEDDSIVSVKDEGNSIWIHNNISKDMYCYHVSQKELLKYKYVPKEMEEENQAQKKISVAEVYKEYQESYDGTGMVSEAVCIHKKDESVYAWLSFEGCKARDVFLVIRNKKNRMMYPIFNRERF